MRAGDVIVLDRLGRVYDALMGRSRAEASVAGAQPATTSAPAPAGRGFRYGDDRTIHSSQLIDVEITAGGTVVAVWFRCMPLPFKVMVVGRERAREMRQAYETAAKPLLAVVVDDPERARRVGAAS